LYVFKAIVGSNKISELLVLGGLSLIIWTLTLQTTIKYVIITLRADNKGEGGVFSLFTLVRRRAKWLIVPAIIGGCALLADGIITPPSPFVGSRRFTASLSRYSNRTHRYLYYFHFIYHTAIWYLFRR
jgi:KUP system potassium uptake protein